MRLHFRDRTTVSNHQRQQFWTTLTEDLSDLPSRNQFLCTGDFNCSLPQCPPWSGTSDFYWCGARQKGPQHRDMTQFLDCLRQHSLVALNSWQQRSGPTYFHGVHASRIDFLLGRVVTSDGTSKQVTYLEHADFLPMNSTHHVPMVCTIQKHHVAYHKIQNPQACNYQQRAACRQAAVQDLPDWHPLQQVVDHSGPYVDPGTPSI